jgi:hypothetical protein
LSDDSGCRRNPMSDCTSFTVHVYALFFMMFLKGLTFRPILSIWMMFFIAWSLVSYMIWNSISSTLVYSLEVELNILFASPYVKVMRSLIQIHIILFFLNFRIFGWPRSSTLIVMLQNTCLASSILLSQKTRSVIISFL